MVRRDGQSADGLLVLWGYLLRLHRERASLTQAELGALLNPPVGQPTIHKWETGRREPRRRRKAQLAKALRTRTATLFPTEEEIAS